VHLRCFKASLATGGLDGDVLRNPCSVVCRLAQSVSETNSSWSQDQRSKAIEGAIDEMSRTPPVPWVQQNFWPAHHGDFCRYVGEWSQKRLTDEASNQNGLEYLLSILRDPAGVSDPKAL
jgi:uncharacterized protein CbrC (UPF0167 family)